MIKTTCTNIGIVQLKSSSQPDFRGKSNQYLYGYRYIKEKGIVFSVFNSAWNEVKTVTRDSRWLGLSLVRNVRLEVKKNIIRKYGEPIVISVFHHPLDYMNSEDSDERYSSKETTKEHLEELSSIVLNGHTHGGIKAPGSIGNNIRVFKSGSVHSTDTQIFEFEIISIDIMRWAYKQYVGMYEQSKWKIEPYQELGQTRQSTKYFKFGQIAADIFLDSVQSGNMSSEHFDELQPIVKTLLQLFKSSTMSMAEGKLFVSNFSDDTKNHIQADSEVKNNIVSNLKGGKKNEPII